MLILRSRKALEAVVKHQGKLGADAEITVGTIGAGMEGRRRPISAPISSSSPTRPASYAGGSVEGSVLARRNDYNQAFYGTGVSPEAILFGQGQANPAARRAAGRAVGALTRFRVQPRSQTRARAADGHHVEQADHGEQIEGPADVDALGARRAVADPGIAGHAFAIAARPGQGQIEGAGHGGDRPARIQGTVLAPVAQHDAQRPPGPATRREDRRDHQQQAGQPGPE